MPSKTLLNYINTELAKNISEASIRTQCLAAGWPAAMVNEAFAYLASLKNGPNSPATLSLKKKSRLFFLMRLGFGLLGLKYLFTLITMAATTVIMQRAASVMLPFQLLKLNGWFYPTIIGLSFVASFCCLKLFFSLPQRTSSVWKRAVLSLILVVLIEVAFQYLVIRFSLPLSQINNSQ